MFIHNKYLPDDFDDYLILNKESFGMPNETAFSVTLNYTFEGESRNWKRVWYVSDLEIKLMEVDLLDLPSKTISNIAHEHIHRFKKDISLYLKQMSYELISIENALCLREK
ncbi:hypothetical protein [Vibrio marisflavi]|uniref:Uncharacterized protein n=1 Tax=Vibrio marisflavi CECT 7928 TaxID=634439 RepID=A0ABM9A029_9VIBR|nr:hypothetical protein [Vibrio marisflavi]CAH0536835.1 hypothetical protein VMF7928_00725 [Vibrio marisflavi CECT 7928]